MIRLVIAAMMVIPLHISYAQPDTEIYVFDLVREQTGYVIKNPVNITYNNPGYDNQPHFRQDGTLYYVSTKNGQTDVAQVELKEYSWQWLTNTSGSEYSPTPLPDGSGFSAINLEKDGTQLLWKYPTGSGQPEIIVPDLKIGYHCWYNTSTLVAFVLGSPSTLQVIDLETGKQSVQDTSIGRSLHHIPGSNEISYISKQHEVWEIKGLDPITGKTRRISNTLEGSEDMCWAPDGTLFMGQGDQLFAFKPGKDEAWSIVPFVPNPLFEHKKVLKQITRLHISPDGNKIAIVVAAN